MSWPVIESKLCIKTSTCRNIIKNVKINFFVFKKLLSPKCWPCDVKTH